MRGATLNNRYLFIGELLLSSALHIGGGDEAYAVSQNAVVKLAGKKPYIPGSSLKGVFRSVVERIAGNLPAVTSCGLFSTADFCLTTASARQEDYKKLREGDISERDLLAFLEENLCETCLLFGSPYIAAKVEFADAEVREPWTEIFEVRDGVGIDRDSQRAVDSAKFDYEAVPAGTGFDFRLAGENLSEKELGLLALGFLEMSAGMVSLGGMTSRGLGRCSLNLEEIGRVVFSDLPMAKNYLRDGKMKIIEDPKEFLREKVTNLVGEG